MPKPGLKNIAPAKSCVRKSKLDLVFIPDELGVMFFIYWHSSKSSSATASPGLRTLLEGYPRNGGSAGSAKTIGGSVGRSGRKRRHAFSGGVFGSFCTRRLATRLRGMFAAISVKLAENGASAARR